MILFDYGAGNAHQAEPGIAIIVNFHTKRKNNDNEEDTITLRNDCPARGLRR